MTHGSVPEGAVVVGRPVADAGVGVEDKSLGAVHGVGGSPGADDVVLARARAGVETVGLVAAAAIVHTLHRVALSCS